MDAKMIAEIARAKARETHTWEVSDTVKATAYAVYCSIGDVFEEVLKKETHHGE
jgi:hypothetical protein